MKKIQKKPIVINAYQTDVEFDIETLEETRKIYLKRHMRRYPISDDTISRRAAIAAANRAYYRGLVVEDVKKVTDEVIKELKQLPSAQQWIPCSERLPEDDVEVLVTECSGCVRWLNIDSMISYEDGSGRAWIYSQNPTAWMPLPEPYKEEQE